MSGPGAAPPPPHPAPTFEGLLAHARAAAAPAHGTYQEAMAAARAALTAGALDAARQGAGQAFLAAPDVHAQALAAHLLADVALHREDLAEAERAYMGAEAFAESLWADDPQDAEACRLLALARLRLGVLAAAQGASGAAARALEGATGVFRALADRPDADAGAQCDLAEAHLACARWLKAPAAAVRAEAAAMAVLRADPDHAPALALLAEALALPGPEGLTRTRLEQAVSLRLKLAAAAPEDPARRAALARAWVGLGAQLLREGAPAVAGPAYAQAEALAQALPAGDAQAPLMRFAALLGMAEAAQAEGALDAAEGALQAAVALAEAADGDGWARQAAVALTRLGASAAARGALEAATAFYRRAQARLAESPTASLRDKALCAARLGECALRVGALAEAQAAFEAGVALHRELVAARPTDRAMRHDLAEQLTRLGVVAQAARAAESAGAAWREALALLDALARWDGAEPSVHVRRADLLSRLCGLGGDDAADHRAAALALLEWLSAAGALAPRAAGQLAALRFG